MTTKQTLIIGVAVLAAGFFLGRCTIQPEIKTEYIKGETIRDTIRTPYPVLVEIPAKPQLPLKPDTVWLSPEVPETDTAAIIAEYIKSRHYSEILFDSDTLGRLKVEAQVQYNILQALGYEFTPVTKQITVERKKVYEPFILTSVNTFGYAGIGGGLFRNNLGITGQYLTNFRDEGVQIGLVIKF